MITPLSEPPDPGLSSELKTLYESLQHCLDLRDKYIRVSQQRLGDNPRDHDGVFFGFNDNAGDVSGIKPDASHESICDASDGTFSPWKIYPRPPPPHWHYNDRGREAEFDFTKCLVPGADSWDFRIDERGVFQVYTDRQAEVNGRS